MIKLEEGWATVLLVAALVTVAAWGVEAPGWAPGLWIAGLAGVSGVLLGVALSKSRFSGPLATLLAAGYGLVLVGLGLCLLLEGTLYRRLWELIIRLNNFLYYALNGGTSRDILPFTFSVGLIFWAIGVSAAWSVFRRGAIWPAILPAGTILLINAYYYVGERLELYVAAYLVLSLLLLTRVNLLSREREWRVARVAFTPDTRFEFLRAGLVAAVAVVMVAWMSQRATDLSASPQAVAVWNRVNGTWGAVRENFERLFNAVRNPGIAATDFYGDSLALTGGTNLSDRRIFDVVISPVNEEGVPTEAEAGLPPVPRFYWRATVYQEYVNGRWQAGNGLEFREQNPQQAVVRLPAARLRRDVAATFTSYLEAPSRLYILPQPKLVNRPVVFEAFVGAGGTLDPVSVRAQQVLTGDDKTYRMVASVSVADVASLRAATQRYPDHIRAYFLQLPDTITQRTRDLARQIVTEAGARTPFDQAQAIVDYLRQNIQYDQGIEPPPSGVEPVDWFLFDYRRGYCNYYASATVILLRSLGIPARMAVGFNEGEFDGETGLYIVRERNAHAWPEVYFPDYGWLEFEPTASEAPLIRPERTVEAADPAPVDRGPEAAPTPFVEPEEPSPLENPDLDAQRALELQALITQVGTGLGVTVLVVVIVAAVGLGALLRARLIGLESLGAPGRQTLRWLGQQVPSAVTAAYLELERAARWLGLALPESLTPAERATELNTTFPAVQPAVDTITAQYVAEQYGPDPDLPNGRLAGAAWREARFKVWREGFQRFFGSWLEDPYARTARRLRAAEREQAKAQQR